MTPKTHSEPRVEEDTSSPEQEYKETPKITKVTKINDQCINLIIGRKKFFCHYFRELFMGFCPNHCIGFSRGRPQRININSLPSCSSLTLGDGFLWCIEPIDNEVCITCPVSRPPIPTNASDYNFQLISIA